MQFVTKTLKSIWKDEEAQGTAEYVLLIVVVVALALIFRPRIEAALRGRLDQIDTGMGGFNVQ